SSIKASRPRSVPSMTGRHPFAIRPRSSTSKMINSLGSHHSTLKSYRLTLPAMRTFLGVICIGIWPSSATVFDFIHTFVTTSSDRTYDGRRRIWLRRACQGAPSAAVPDEFKFEDGKMRRRNLAMAKDNPDKRYMADSDL